MSDWTPAERAMAEVWRRPDRAKSDDNPHQRRRLRMARMMLDAMRDEPDLLALIAEAVPPPPNWRNRGETP